MNQPILNGILESDLDLNGYGFVNIGGLLGTFVTSTESTTVDGQVSLFNGTGGKIIRKATATGIAKLSSGVLSAVTAPTGDLVGHDDTQTLYNKTLALTTIANTGLNFVRPNGAGIVQLLVQDGASSIFSYLPSTSGTLITSAEVSAGYVPTTRTVNGHALSSNVTVTPTDLGLVIGTNVQAYDADLTTWAGLSPSANAQNLVTAANYAAMRTLLGLVIGTDVQAFSANLTLWSNIVPSGRISAFIEDPTLARLKAAVTDETTVGWNLLTLADPSAITFLQFNADNTVTAQSANAQRTALGLAIGTNVQGYDANLTAWATITPSDRVAGFLVSPTLATLKTAVTDETTVGWNLLTLANPSAIRFLQINADNTVTAQSASTQRTALSLVIGTDVEAWLNNPPAGDTIYVLSSTSGGTRSWVPSPITTPATPSNWLRSYTASSGAFTSSRPVIADLSDAGQLAAWAAKTAYAGALTITTGKTFNVTGSLTLAGTDGSTLNIGAGGTLGSNAFNSTTYEVPLTFSTGLTRTTNTVTVNTVQNILRLSNLTTDGVVTVSGNTGTLGSTGNGTVGQVLTSNGSLVAPTFQDASAGGITNSAGATMVPVSDGTNLIASSIVDDGFVLVAGYGTSLLRLDNGDGLDCSLGDTNTAGNGTRFIVSDTDQSFVFKNTDLDATFKYNGNIVDYGGGGVVLYTGGTGTVTNDTGWTANSDSGDKTKVIGSAATLSAIATALDIVTSGAGTQLKNIGEKVKALEAALTAALIPNA